MFHGLNCQLKQPYSKNIRTSKVITNHFQKPNSDVIKIWINHIAPRAILRLKMCNAVLIFLIIAEFIIIQLQFEYKILNLNCKGFYQKVFFV